MKKYFSVVLILAMLAFTAQSFASVQIGSYLLSSGTKLPDPYEITGIYGTLEMSAYEFYENYVCDVYNYTINDGSMNQFITKYSSLAAGAGYKIEDLSVENYKVWSFKNNNYTAYIIEGEPDVDFFLIIENGMPFDARISPTQSSNISGTISTDVTATPKVESTATITVTPTPAPDFCYFCSNTGYIECDTCYGDRIIYCTKCLFGECLECCGDGYVITGFTSDGREKTRKCSYCNSSGRCQTCHGSAYITCPKCHGSGKMACPYCK